MDCRHATELLSQALDRPLGWRERVALRLHLLICDGCTRAKAQFRFLREALSRHPARPEKKDGDSL